MTKEEQRQYNREAMRRWRARNQEKIQSDEYKATQRIRNQKYWGKNKEKLGKINKEYRSTEYAKSRERARSQRRREDPSIREYHRLYGKEWSKTNRGKMRLYWRVFNARKRAFGYLTAQDLQNIYEENIKQFGTLTCYLCLKPIEFGEDCLEHKLPGSRGGTNCPSNLAVAHKSCNVRKHKKTPEEYLARTR